VRITLELLPPASLTLGNLAAFLESLPSLGDDAEAFARDVRPARDSVAVQLPRKSQP
jgi:hypothetical protein